MLAEAATDGGHTVVHGNYFDTLTLQTDRSADALVRDAYEAGFLLHKVDQNTVQLSVDETTTTATSLAIARVLGARARTAQWRGSGPHRHRGLDSRTAAAHERVPHASGLQHAPLRDAP